MVVDGHDMACIALRRPHHDTPIPASNELINGSISRIRVMEQ